VIGVQTVLLVLAVLLVAGTGSALTWLVSRGSRGRARGRAEEITAAGRRLELLGAILEHSPTAVVLYGNLGQVAFSNPAARQLLAEGATLDGLNFLDLLASAPAPLREAALADEDAVFSLEQGEGREAFRLARRHVVLDGEPHILLLLDRLTRELSRSEAAGYKRLIRLLCHELNNSLAPVSSLIHTARVVVQNPAHLERLGTVLDTIDERATHLRTFVEGYARFARLPTPHPSSVPWDGFVARLSTLYPSVAFAQAPPGDGWFDAAQLEQVVINLVKNALESGGAVASAEVSIESMPQGGARLTVSDRGLGMSAEVQQQALLPFFSTKEGGNGLGLPLCKEIVEGHGGTFGFAAREGGGLSVTLALPGHASPASIAHAGRLTLTRG
jgi:two-component system nitrogen regulation sensor histidine kinase NtrY